MTTQEDANQHFDNRLKSLEADQHPVIHDSGLLGLRRLRVSLPPRQHAPVVLIHGGLSARSMFSHRPNRFSGYVQFMPAATKACLLAADFSSSDNDIDVGTDKDFRVGDIVMFSEVDGATLDGGLDAAVKHRVSAVAADGKVTVVVAADGSAVTLAGDGVDNGGHVEMQMTFGHLRSP